MLHVLRACEFTRTAQITQNNKALVPHLKFFEVKILTLPFANAYEI